MPDPGAARPSARVGLGAAVVLGLLTSALSGCDNIRTAAAEDAALRMCKARANAAGLDLARYRIRDVAYSGPETGDHFIAMVADSTPPPDHVLVCQLQRDEGGLSITSALWDGALFERGDRWDPAAGKWIRVHPPQPAMSRGPAPASLAAAALPAVSGRYYDARARLLALGYQPLSVNSRGISACLEEQKTGRPLDGECPAEVTWPEIADCAGTGIGACMIYWKSPSGRVLLIATDGEPQPGVVNTVRWATKEDLADLGAAGALSLELGNADQP